MVTSTRRLAALLATLSLALVGLVSLTAGPALARPVAAPAGNCTKPSSYPPRPDATIMISATNTVVGATVKVSGINFCPNESVSITIDGAVVGSATTDANGAFDPPVIVPGPPGQKTVCGTGATGLSNDTDCLTISVAAAVVDTSTADPNDGGDTAFTGVEIGALVALALVLLGAGIAFSTAGRAKRARAHQ